MVEKVPHEQIVYANILYYGSIIGMILLTITFAIYVSGLVAPFIEYEKIVELWKHDTHYLIKETKIPTGWGWLSMIGYSDFLNLLTLAFLAILTIVCYIAIIPIFLSKKDFIYTLLAIAEIIILLLAASGILQVGH